MKTLITGSSGMVGKELQKELKSHKLVLFDHTLGDDILDKKSLKKKMKRVDCVVHLAGVIDNSNPKLWEVNVKGTENAIDSAIESGAKKFVFMSSTAVYGNTLGAVDENTKVCPENAYEKSKLAGEAIVLSKKSKIEVCIIRSAMVLGANEYWKKMFKMLKKKYPLPLNGNNHFQVIYSKELARAIAGIIKNGKTGEIYLAAGNEKKTLNEFCNMVQEELGIEKKITHIPTVIGILIGKILNIKLLTPDNIRHLGKERNYNTKKLKKAGYRQKYNLREAIQEIAEEFKEKE